MCLYRDWDMLVTIVGQLSEHIAEKKVNEMLISLCLSIKACLIRV